MAAVETEGAGFNFDLCRRNEHLIGRGVKPPGLKKTGTTIAGIVFKVKVTFGLAWTLFWQAELCSTGPVNARCLDSHCMRDCYLRESLQWHLARPERPTRERYSSLRSLSKFV
jgi:hypothetical protein